MAGFSCMQIMFYYSWYEIKTLKAEKGGEEKPPSPVLENVVIHRGPGRQV